jgi:hypothetical protein
MANKTVGILLPVYQATTEKLMQSIMVVMTVVGGSGQQ